MLIIATGISGCGRKDYLAEFEKIAKKNGKKIKVYHMGQKMFEQAAKIGVNISKENVLNTNPYVINSLRSAVFEDVLSDLPKDLKKYHAVIINEHSFFFWKKIFMRAYDSFYLSQLNPDIFITFIDNAQSIKDKLDKREQWNQERLSLEEILLWQNVEVEVSASWADLQKRPFYTIARSQPTESMFRLLFQQETEPVYVSMPMTHMTSPKDKRKVDVFVKELEKYFIVFDPRTIEINTTLPKKIDAVSYNQTVLRDLYWIIRQSKKIITYFPKVVSSPGAINELREGYETSKDVWLVYPEQMVSPFLSYFCNRLFRGEKEFYTFLKKTYKKLKPLKK